MMKRVVFDVLLVLSFVFLPWFVSVPLVLVGCIFVTDFYEGILLSAAFDLMHGPGVGNIVPMVTASALTVFAISPFVRAHIRWN